MYLRSSLLQNSYACETEKLEKSYHDKYDKPPE